MQQLLVRDFRSKYSKHDLDRYKGKHSRNPVISLILSQAVGAYYGVAWQSSTVSTRGVSDVSGWW